jgi:glycosyltransferase involved in cell wall biosynthesis
MMVGTVDISIVIPSYNRGVGVCETVQKCLRLSPAPREIILVDDCSDEESAAVLRSAEQGIVKYIGLPENQGQATARSVGFATARGRYLVSLDDDSWFLDGDALQRVWTRLEGRPNCGILAFRAFSPCVPVEPARERLSLVADHIGCGAAYRAHVLRASGYHVPFMRYVGEEADLTVQVMSAGFDVVLDESIRVFHNNDPATRSRVSLARVRRFGVRNDLLRAWIYFPVDLAIAVTLLRIASHLGFGLRHGFFTATLRGYLEFVLRFPQALLHRRPVRRKAALRYLRLRRRPEVQ